MSTPISAKCLFLCSLTKFVFSNFVAEFHVYFSSSLIYQPFSAHGYARKVYMLFFLALLLDYTDAMFPWTIEHNSVV
jgi:hypothetical protein